MMVKELQARGIFGYLASFLFLILPVLVWAGPEDTAPTGSPQVQVMQKEEIGAKPGGLIAFVRDGNVWIMDSDGKNQQQICAADNGRGRLSFSPDNKMVAFVREGREASKLPSGEGGAHLLTDIFIAYLDSARTNPGWWKRWTFGLGASNPEWQKDGTIYVQYDIHANEVDYILPSFQIAKIIGEGDEFTVLRKDTESLNTSMRSPTLSPDGKKLAYEIFFDPDPNSYRPKFRGVKVIAMANIMMTEDSIRVPGKGLESAVAPSWSPDGKWLAFVENDLRNSGLYIFNTDSGEKRLVYSPPVTKQIMPNPPGWAPNSKWLCFATSDGVVYTVDINGDRLTPLTGTGNIGYPTWSK
jgi:Tol biopolymer transport system component